MQITLNGQQKELTQTQSLQGVIDQFCKNSHLAIAEINGNIVKNTQWEKTAVKDGDTIELVRFVGGG